MNRFFKNTEGFTLVELMVVVAIIGILSAIAVPNFKKYQAKSKQSEAKIQLAALYSTEVAANADYDTYAVCLLDLGYEQPPKGYYIVGFAAVDTASQTIVTNRGGTCSATGFAVAPPTATHLKVDSATLPTAAALTTTSVTTTTFNAAAAGDISGSGAAFDLWRINEAKALSNPAVGF